MKIPRHKTQTDRSCTREAWNSSDRTTEQSPKKNKNKGEEKETRSSRHEGLEWRQNWRLGSCSRGGWVGWTSPNPAAVGIGIGICICTDGGAVGTTGGPWGVGAPVSPPILQSTTAYRDPFKLLVFSYYYYSPQPPLLSKPVAKILKMELKKD